MELWDCLVLFSVGLVRIIPQQLILKGINVLMIWNFTAYNERDNCATLPSDHALKPRLLSANLNFVPSKTNSISSAPNHFVLEKSVSYPSIEPESDCLKEQQSQFKVVLYSPYNPLTCQSLNLSWLACFVL